MPIMLVPMKTNGTMVSIPTATHVMFTMLFQCVAAVPLMAPVELALLMTDESSRTPMSMARTSEKRLNIKAAFTFVPLV